MKIDAAAVGNIVACQAEREEQEPYMACMFGYPARQAEMKAPAPSVAPSLKP